MFATIVTFLAQAAEDENDAADLYPHAGELIVGAIAFLEGGFLVIFAPFTFVFSVVLVAFEIFVSVLQAFIFSILTASYIGGALAEEH